MILEQCDTSKEDDIKAMLDRVRGKHGPLHAVLYAAGVLADGVLDKQNAGFIQQVWGPKADGAWFVHKHSAENDPDLHAFVAHSPVVALFGNTGQSNYSAANEYLDNLI